MPKLNVTAGANRGNIISFSDLATLGRSSEATLVLDDLRSSRFHAKIFLHEEGFYLEDTGSQNGTFLNGRRVVEPTKLRNYDKVQIGTTWITFVHSEESLKIGEYFLDYKISREQGSTNLGKIFLANQGSLSRDVFLLVYPKSQLTETPELEEHFHQCMAGVVQLFHPNIAIGLDYGYAEKNIYCVFEELDFNDNLKTYIEKNPNLAYSKRLRIASQIIQGVCYAHQYGCNHFYLYPESIIVEEDIHENIQVKILGYGLARFLTHVPAISSDHLGVLPVTRGHLSENTAHKSDSFSLGAVLYWLVTGMQFPGIENLDRKSLNTIEDVVQGVLSSEMSSHDALKRVEEEYSEARFQEMLKTEAGQNMVQEVFGKKKILFWWILAPVLSTILGSIVFFLF